MRKLFRAFAVSHGLYKHLSKFNLSHYMELKDLKLKTEKELRQILNEFRDKLRDLRFKDANKQLKDVREIREVKKTVARVLTLLKVNK